jgi:hypothetical protein
MQIQKIMQIQIYKIQKSCKSKFIKSKNHANPKNHENPNL